MANQKIIAKKQEVVDEIVENFKSSTSVVFFEYSKLSVVDMTDLRRQLKENDAELKVYKNTLTKRALDELEINLDDHMNGPKAVAYGKDAVVPVKIVSEFAKKNPSLEIKVGIIEGNVTSMEALKEIASIPSREGLLTMIAGGLMQVTRDLAICIDLHIQNLEK